jgi:hypothetical protein
MQNFSPFEVCPSLEQVERQFEAWRNQPQRSRKIPLELWEAVARLCVRCSVLQVSRTPRLGYNELKERVQRTSQPASPSPFVELSPLLPASEMVVDCEDASGRRMRIQYQGANPSDVLRLLETFREAGR